MTSSRAIAQHSTALRMMSIKKEITTTTTKNLFRDAEYVRVNLFLCGLDHQFIMFFYEFLYLFRTSCFARQRIKKKRDKETRVSARAFLLALTKDDRETLLR